MKVSMIQKFGSGCRRLISTSIAMTGAIFLSVNYAFAQIIPDGSLGTESSTVVPSLVINGISSDRIDGGAIRNTNLFHSFQDFNINVGRAAYFSNPAGIENIISRVTGSNPSNISGKLGVLGNANLFLMNPNGIIFDKSASLDLKGSFLATTANNIKFADSTNFSATNPQTTSVLTVSAPIGLGFGTNPGAIAINNSTLEVSPGKTLALVGGDITMQGGTLSAPGKNFPTQPGGRIELGSVGSNSEVTISPAVEGWTLNYGSVQNFQDIQLSQNASVDASGRGGGNIQTRSNLLTLTQNSGIIANTLGTSNGGGIDINADIFRIQDGAKVSASTFSQGTGGDLNINAANSIELNGNGIPSLTTKLNTRTFTQSDIANGLFALSFGTGAGGAINVNTKSLTLLNGAGIISAAFSSGQAGNMLINASEKVELISNRADNVSILFSATQNTGAAGNLTIETKQLNLDYGSIFSGTYSSGRGGDLNINATESVEINNSLISSLAATGTIGDAGNLTVTTDKLIVNGGLQGGGISTSTFGSGKGGNLTVNASESVELSGYSSSGVGLFARSRRTGTAGNLTVNTGELIVRDGAEITVAGSGSGSAGNIQIQADAIKLDNNGLISAATLAGNGGNIILEASTLQLRRNSRIVTTAGGNANGGNIFLNTDTLVALEKSSITANAFQGRGGTIQIQAQGLFLSPDSTITASSELGVNGVVQVTTFGFDVNNFLTLLTDNFVSTEQVIAGSCLANSHRGEGSFKVTGNGGLPRHPYDEMIDRYTITQVKPIAPNSSNTNTSSRATVKNNYSWKLGDPILEAQNIAVLPDGRKLLGILPIGTLASATNLICYHN